MMFIAMGAIRALFTLLSIHAKSEGIRVGANLFAIGSEAYSLRASLLPRDVTDT